MARTTKPVFIVGTGQTFPSASAAAKALGINRSNIYSVLAGRRKTAGGQQFGYASNKAVSVSKNGSTQVYSNLTAAARAVKANPTKVENIVSAGIDKTVKGYSFSYIDTSKISYAPSVPSVPKNRKKKKAEQARERKAKQREKAARKQQKEEKRKREREESAKKHRRDEKLKSLGEAYTSYKDAKSVLLDYVKKVNEQIDKYIDVNPALLYYHQSTPAVFGLQMYVGYEYGPYDITYFDESLKNFELPENIDDLTKDDTQKLADKMSLLAERMKSEAERKGRSFFDMTNAERNRTDLAFEFYKNTGHENDMDQYAYMIWDILDTIQRSNMFPELGSDLVFNMVSDAMQGNVDKDVLDRFIQDLDGWMNRYGSQEELDEILSELDGTYSKPTGFSVFDDDWGWTD